MNNYIAPGNSVQVTIPYAVSAGSGVLVGTGLFGVAQNTYASGATGILATEGVYTRLVKASGTGEAWAVGDPLYWNDTNKNLVKASGTGNTANPVALCLEVVGTAVTTGGEVKLRPY
jgi:predicted RecA/RadA family phage recombinase